MKWLVTITLVLLVNCDRPHGVLSDENSDALKMAVSQLEMLQFISTERVRSAGNSGIKKIHIKHAGIQNYQTESFSGATPAGAHDLPNYKNRVGIGEFAAAINGFEFNSRRKYYNLVKPSKSKKDLHATEDIEFPKVPSHILNEKNADKQIGKMRDLIKAWIAQKDPKKYKDYFKPVLCYLEGAWFHDNATLPDKEDLGPQPTMMFATRPFSADVSEVPVSAKWHHRILCHEYKPKGGNFPTNYLHAVEELSPRFFRKEAPFSYKIGSIPGARFGFNVEASPDPGGMYYTGLLDHIMGQIPGKDNYGGKIESSKEGADKVFTTEDPKKFLNQAFYHRWYQGTGKDASGLSFAHRGFCDDFFFGARTTHEAVAGRYFHPKCWIKKQNVKNCKIKFHRWTWAIPIDFIYLTPLHEWNPYNLEIKTSFKEISENGKRDGSCTKDKAFLGVSPDGGYYLTPESLFTGDGKDDGVKSSALPTACVLDKNKVMRKMKASGVHLRLPTVAGVSERSRTRFPVFPVYGEGDATSKELNAIRDMFYKPEFMREYSHKSSSATESMELILFPSLGVKGVSGHTHRVKLSEYNARLVRGGKEIILETEESEGHTHEISFIRRIATKDQVSALWYVNAMDGKKTESRKYGTKKIRTALGCTTKNCKPRRGEHLHFAALYESES